MPYKFWRYSQEDLPLLFDTLNNAVTMTFVLFLNLVLSHSLSASLHLQKRHFYVPKIIVCLCVLVSMWGWLFTDQLNYRAFFSNDFEVDDAASHTEEVCYSIFLCFMFVYGILNAYYCFLALKMSSALS